MNHARVVAEKNIRIVMGRICKYDIQKVAFSNIAIHG